LSLHSCHRMASATCEVIIWIWTVSESWGQGDSFRHGQSPEACRQASTRLVDALATVALKLVETCAQFSLSRFKKLMRKLNLSKFDIKFD
jgi:hypothetical protein